MLPLRAAALQAHQANQLGRAESLYRDALDENPEDVDVLHMLGVVLFQRLRYREALECLWLAAEKTGWGQAQIRHNLGLVLAKSNACTANRIQAGLFDAFLAQQAATECVSSTDVPLVSVILPAYNHERHVAEAIASVLSQTYPRIELIVIDDGSSDATLERARASLVGASMPCRLVTRANRGAPASLNEGAALAAGEYLAVLNSDDLFAPDRIEKLVQAVARIGAQWGISLVSAPPQEGAANCVEYPASEQACRVKQTARLGRAGNSFAWITHDNAISTGNLFVARELFESLGGFRDYRYSYGWDFCVRAAGQAEPVVVMEPLYFRRRHERNADNAARRAGISEVGRMVVRLLDESLAGSCVNPLAPQWPANRVLLMVELLEFGLGEHVPTATLRAFANESRMISPATRPAHAARSTPPGRRGRTALVVLGMHRSGTSALTRILNLCGAHLPDKLRPPKQGVNEKGFWESDDIIELNDRVLASLDAAWHRVPSTLPEAGTVVEDFVDDAGSVLATEFGDNDTILIKDPRIGVLAPLWHKALIAAGYRPVYVVSLRNPLEVAHSLHARGDMSVREGMDLWHDYMSRIADFTKTGVDAMSVRFDDLLLDWRGLVGRISDRLDVRLDPRSRAEEADAFLDPDLRRQAMDDGELDAFPDDPGMPALRALYRESLGRCEGPAAPRRWVAGDTGIEPQTAAFVLCIEDNAIKEQALLLCESIRRFGGVHRDAPVLAFAPRPGLGIDRETAARLRDMDVTYVDEPLNTLCPVYGSANRVFSAAWAEANVDADFVVVLDSDTVFLAEPELPGEGDLAVRPVDSKGSATGGPGDPYEDYWAALAGLHGTPLDRLPFLRTTIDGQRIRASYNGGLIVARRERKLMSRWAYLFARSIEAGLRPYRNSGIDIVASTGNVGKAASEYWGSNQAALAIVAWDHDAGRVMHLPSSYNMPLHLLAEQGGIDGTWNEFPPVHVHYHWMFDRERYEIALEILDQLDVPKETLAWLARRIPIGSK